MRLKPAQLDNHLKRQGLAPLYVLMGDEPLQMMEYADKLRQFAHDQGFTERVILTVEAGFNWEELEEQTDSFSLFAKKRLLELRLTNKSPGTQGAKALIAYANKPPSDTRLLISLNKLDASKQKTKWFKTLEERGVLVQIWPLNVSELPGWITQRMRLCNLQASSETINMIAERAEGHLLACAQEIEKLHLLYGAGQISTAQVLETMADSARFQAFDWVDAVLAGEAPRCVRQLQGLRRGNADPVFTVWVLNKEIRNLCNITAAIQGGQRRDQVFKTYHVWSTRRNILSRAIDRHPHSRVWQRFLRRTVQIEGMIKGVGSGNYWDELQRLTLWIAGVRILTGVRKPIY